VVYLAAVRQIARTLPLLLLASVACGYSLVGYDAGFEGIRTVAIETPANDSFVPGAEYVVADALRREFQRRGAVRVIDEPDAADLVIAGSVAKVSSRGRSFSSVVFSLEFELTLKLDLEARLSDGRILPIGPHSLEDSELYLASADVEATRKNRDEALRRVAVVIAQRVHDNLFEAGAAPAEPNVLGVDPQ
jgi:hypothetical protein